jgi:hypothetical protein
MSTAALAFDWKAPVPQVFTRSSGPTFWPGDRRCRPLDWSFRRIRDLTFLTRGLPPELTTMLKDRFKPARGALTWETPPALPSNQRQPYPQDLLTGGSNKYICREITVTAGLIERLLNAPEGMVGGLTHNYLLAIQLLRLRQLWEEVQRRAWPEDRLSVFKRALG